MKILAGTSGSCSLKFGLSEANQDLLLNCYLPWGRPSVMLGSIRSEGKSQRQFSNHNDE
jgi:hypothetical protein